MGFAFAPDHRMSLDYAFASDEATVFHRYRVELVSNFRIIDGGIVTEHHVVQTVSISAFKTGFGSNADGDIDGFIITAL